MNTFDYLVLLFLLIHILLSAWRGFVSEAVNFSAWILSILAAWLLYPTASSLFFGSMENKMFASIIAFGLVFICMRILMYALRNLLNAIIEATPLSIINRILGVILGVCKGIVYTTLLVSLLVFSDLPQSIQWKQALTLPYFEQLSLIAAPFLPDFWAEQIFLSFPSHSLYLE